MLKLKGQPACAGIASAPIHFVRKVNLNTSKRIVRDADEELIRFRRARSKAKQQLQEIYDKSVNSVGSENAVLFVIHQLMLEDPDYESGIEKLILENNYCAEFSVAHVSQKYIRLLSNIEDPYLRERSADVSDVSRRLLHILCDVPDNRVETDVPVIIAAEDLNPSEAAQLDREKILGFVTNQGSVNSHTAIIARTMGIPAVVNAGEKINPLIDGKHAFLDGEKGELYIEPDERTIEILKNKEEDFKRRLALLEKLKGVKSKTLDGKKVHILANIGNLDDLDFAFQNDAQGIGLFRSEFLFLGKGRIPAENEQFEVYKEAVSKLKGKRMVIRTLDFGADKVDASCDGLIGMHHEFGIRGLRFMLYNIKIFKAQLRAIYRATAFGKISILFPMVSFLEELIDAKSLCEEVKNELKAEGTDFDPNTEIGVMIETPSAALISDKLAEYADFFSIGTNDLTQLTEGLSEELYHRYPYHDSQHRAVLELISITVKNAKKKKIKVSMCGELGTDLALTDKFLKMGIREFSVAPTALLKLKEKIISTDISNLN